MVFKCVSNTCKGTLTDLKSSNDMTVMFCGGFPLKNTFVFFFPAKVGF